MSRAVTLDRVKGTYFVECPNRRCAHQFQIPHNKIDKKQRCPRCRSAFVPRDQVVSQRPH